MHVYTRQWLEYISTATVYTHIQLLLLNVYIQYILSLTLLALLTSAPLTSSALTTSAEAFF